MAGVTPARRARLRLGALLAAGVVLSAGCHAGTTFGRGRNCTEVHLASSPEKFALFTELAQDFNKSTTVNGKCVSVKVDKKSSGAGAQALVDDWPEGGSNGPRPVVWSPAASSWGAVVNQRRADKGAAAIVPSGAKPFMLTPLTIAMPKPMATALGWPNTAIGYSDLVKLATDPTGWAAKGHPEWGPFKLGKTNPNFSTSALSATIAQYYAATNKVRDLSLEDVNNPQVEQAQRAVESAVVHYGDTTLTFLNNLYRADARGTGLTYVSAVAVEEKSVIDYNTGNPDGILDPGEKPRPPRVPLVAIYPKEGTLFSDNPFFVLDAPWVSAEQRQAARSFETFVQQPDNQRKVLTFGFRPGNPSVPLAAPINGANGVDPAQPQTTLGVPAPAVLVKLLEKWGTLRKGAKVLLVVDVSGSMGDDASPNETKLDLAKRAAVGALDQFKSDDEVGLRIFSTQIKGGPGPTDYADLVPVGPIASNRERLISTIGDLTPTNGTPLYTAAGAAYDDVKKAFDPTRINAVLLLTDGQNEDPRNDDLDGLVRKLRAGSEGSGAGGSSAVRLFTIAYGRDADLPVLKRIAEATNGAAYDAKDPTTIDQVFTAVVSNF
jgi:Ca-activated chloride channel family protein